MSTFTVTHPSKTIILDDFSNAQSEVSFLCLPSTSVTAVEVDNDMDPIWEIAKSKFLPIDVKDFLFVDKLSQIEKARVLFLMQHCKMSINEAVDVFGMVLLYQGALLPAATMRFNNTFIDRIPNSIKPYIAYDKYASDMKNSKTLIEFHYQSIVYTCMNARKFL